MTKCKVDKVSEKETVSLCIKYGPFDYKVSKQAFFEDEK